MNKVMLAYPPGQLLQRSEDRAQCNVDESAAISVHACNDLGYCAAVLLQKEYEVFLRDYQTEGAAFADAAKDVESFCPDMIVVSTTNTSVREDIAFLHRLRQIRPCVCVLKGAVFYDIDPALLKRLDLSDISCLIGSEMEFVIGRLADHYLRDACDPAEINGIFYKKDGVFVKNAFRCGSNDLDTLPFPARQLMNNAIYVRPDTGEPMATIQTGLGCPSGCIYCLTPVISGKTARKRSPENVLREIDECYTVYGIRNFFFKADTFTIDEAYAAEICDRIIASELHGKIAFTVNTRVKPLSEALARKLKEAGCFTVAVGFESGCDETLRRIGKGTSVADNLRAAKILKEAGLPIYGFFMIGFPWETEEMIRETERLMHRISPDFIELHIATPFYGTAFYELCRQEGLLTDDAFGADAYNPASKGTKYVSREELLKIKDRMLLRYYVRVGYVARKLAANVTKPVVIKNYIAYGMRMLRNIARKGRKGTK